MNILNKLTIKHLTMNKKRTLVTIIGIVLSTALMVGIGCLVSTFREYSLQEIISNQGDHHVELENMPGNTYSYIDSNVQIENQTSFTDLGYTKLVNGENQYKPYLFAVSANENFLNKLTLLKGRLPKNDHEIVVSNHIIKNGGVLYKVGDKLTLTSGRRLLKGVELHQKNGFDFEEVLETGTEKVYEVVGIVERSIYEDYTSPGYMVFTRATDQELTNAKTYTTYLTYKKTSDIHKKTEDLLTSIGLTKKIVPNYNEALLSFYGQSSFENINQTLSRVLGIVLSLLVVACAIVIYNSFAISVMERKKQFGLFASIGTTKKQIKKTVFFEAIIVGGIGILVGTLAGIFGIYIVLEITGALLPEMFEFPLKLSLYPTFIIIPILFMIVTVFISAFIPSHRAAKVSPIEAIRQNDDIKIKKRKLKTFAWVRRVFGVEGELALKNIKRNKKKYRITILSLVVSIVLFISFSTFFEYGNNMTSNFLEINDYDIEVSHHGAKETDLENSLFPQFENMNGIDDSIYARHDYFLWVKLENRDITDKFKEENQQLLEAFNNHADVDLVTLKMKDYEEYIKELNLNRNEYLGSTWKPILLNQVIRKNYDTQKVENYQIFKNNSNRSLSYPYTYGSVTNDSERDLSILGDTYLTDKTPKLMSRLKKSNSLVVIISEKMYSELLNHIKQASSLSIDENTNEILYIKSDKHVEVTKKINQLIETENIGKNYYNVADIAQEQQMENNLKVVIAMFLYGFITLVTLIGVTSVLNTINTSIALRAKEFAVLRSIGLTSKGFNKMLRFESLFYGMKALLYGIPLSFIVMFLFHSSFQGMVASNFMIPWNAVFIAVIVVFLITSLTMRYATRKVKKDNIIDTIREENI